MVLNYFRDRLQKSLDHRLQHYDARLAALESKLDRLISAPLPAPVNGTVLPAPADNEMATQIRQIAETVNKTSATVEALSFMLNDNAAIKTLPINDKLMLVKLTFGPSLFMDPRDYMLSMSISRVGYWEPDNTHFVSSRVRHGVNCIDVGANYGYYMALFRGIVGDTAQVLAFEPNPAVFDYLRRTAFALYMGEYKSNPDQRYEDFYNFSDDRFGMVYNIALGDEKTTMKLNYFGHIYGGSTLLGAREMGVDIGTTSVDVEVLPLDSLDVDTSKPAFWKIDAEGSEYRILKGATKTIEKLQQLDIMIEYEPGMAGLTIPPADYFRFIDSLGLGIAIIRSGAKTEPISPSEAANLPAMESLHLFKK